MSATWNAEIFICPTVNLPDTDGLGGHSHLYRCCGCQRFVPFDRLALNCPSHEPTVTDDIDDLVDWQLSQRPAKPTTVARCLTHGTEWNADAADFCPSCPQPRPGVSNG